MDFTQSYRNLKKPNEMQKSSGIESKFGEMISELMNANISTHKLHLKITGDGSYAAHTALGSFYGEMPGHIDSLVESFQGAHEMLLSIPEKSIKNLNSVKDCLSYLKEIYDMIDSLQKEIPYSEIVNDMDVVKSLINSTKYKLMFLK